MWDSRGRWRDRSIGGGCSRDRGRSPGWRQRWLRRGRHRDGRSGTARGRLRHRLVLGSAGPDRLVCVGWGSWCSLSALVPRRLGGPGGSLSLRGGSHRLPGTGGLWREGGSGGSGRLASAWLCIPVRRARLTCALHHDLLGGAAVGALAGLVDAGDAEAHGGARRQLRHVEVAVGDARADDLPLVLPWGGCRGRVRAGAATPAPPKAPCPRACKAAGASPGPGQVAWHGALNARACRAQSQSRPGARTVGLALQRVGAGGLAVRGLPQHQHRVLVLLRDLGGAWLPGEPCGAGTGQVGRGQAGTSTAPTPGDPPGPSVPPDTCPCPYVPPPGCRSWQQSPGRWRRRTRTAPRPAGQPWRWSAAGARPCTTPRSPHPSAPAAACLQGGMGQRGRARGTGLGLLAGSLPLPGPPAAPQVPPWPIHGGLWPGCSIPPAAHTFHPDDAGSGAGGW